MKRVFGTFTGMTSGAVTIRHMLEADLDAADRVMRIAFGTFLKAPDPEQFMGDADYVHTRWKADPSAAFCAEVGGVIVGSVFVGNWGSVGFFGPLTIHPDYWDRGVAQLLMQPVMDYFKRQGIPHTGLYTFPTSLKHIGLYRKFGFSPKFLTIDMEKEPVDVIADSWTKFSGVAMADREAMLGRCRVLTGNVLEGLDVGIEIRSVAEQRLGETVLLWNADELVGLAVCHYGAGTEAGSGSCYIKFAAAAGELKFRRLLAACEQLAVQQGLKKVSGGVNTARQEAWAVMLDCGWRGTMVGLVMQDANGPGYNRPGVFLIDDWR